MNKTEQFVARAKAAHPDAPWVYSQTEYTKALEPVKVICRVHGPFTIRADALVRTKDPQGCRACGLERRRHPGQKTNETFIAQAKAKWGDLYDYTDTMYVNKITKIKYTCPEHGVVEQMPVQHLKNGCPFCAGRGVGKHTLESFVKKAREIHGELYNYDKVQFDSVQDKVVIRCRLCDQDFVQAVKNHINDKNGCPHCHGGRHKT